MNNVSLSLHSARSVRIQRTCLNGQWQLQITVALENDGRADLTIYAEKREALEFDLPDDVHYRITLGDSTVERSDQSFDDSPSVIGATPEPKPTREEAEAAWRKLFAARLVEHVVLDQESADACAAAHDVDLSVDPAEAADEEVQYWDADDDKAPVSSEVKR